MCDPNIVNELTVLSLLLVRGQPILYDYSTSTLIPVLTASLMLTVHAISRYVASISKLA